MGDRIDQVVDKLLEDDDRGWRAEAPSKSDANRAMEVIKNFRGAAPEKIKKAFLTYQGEGSNKFIYVVVLQVDEPENMHFDVISAHGRIGYEPTAFAVAEDMTKEEAVKAFDAYVAKKLKKGYEVRKSTEA